MQQHRLVHDKLKHPFKIIAFDWDGTAVKNRAAPVDDILARLEALMALDVRIAIITGTHLGNPDRQFCAKVRPELKRNLFACVNRGAEVYGFDDEGAPVRVRGREATDDENRKMDRVSVELQREFKADYGLDVAIVYDRFNRRKLDIIPVPEWADPPKERIGELLVAVEQRLREHGVAGGIQTLIDRLEEKCREVGIELRITTDVKHLEYGLSDKSDAVEWIIDELAKGLGAPNGDVLFLGDEFGPIGGFEGSDFKMVSPVARGAVYVSVGKEPNGVPDEVMYYGKGTAGFVEIMDTQIALRRAAAQRVGETARDSLRSLLSSADWHIVQKGHRPDETPKYETLFTLANGYMGTRGAYEEPVAGGYPATYIAGVFDRTVTFPEELVNAPNWLGIEVRVNGELLGPGTGRLLTSERRLDMRNGLLYRRTRWRDAAGRITRLETLRLVHLRDKHRALIRGIVVPENHDAEVEIAGSVDGAVANTTLSPAVWVRHCVPRRAEEITSGGVYLEVETFHSAIAIGMASSLTVDGDATHHVEVLPQKVVERAAARIARGTALSFAKHVAIVTSRDTNNVGARARAELRAMTRQGPDAVVETHCAAWHEAWAGADVEIAGDRESQRAVRFSIFHLLGLASEHDEDVSVAAKGLHGDGYRGSVFWDTELFMLPFYIYTNPRAARALLMYRARRLDAARANARSNGYCGAQFPWESGSMGQEVTPPRWMDPITLTGPPVRTGEQQHHVVADVAFGFDHYLRAAGDGRLLVEHAAEVFVETARFWASRVRLDARTKRYVIERVIGPDEAHEGVNNNRYTNRLAAWNLVRACDALDEIKRRAPREWRRLTTRLRVGGREPAQWRRIAERMWYPPASPRGVLEQHEGYFKLRSVRVKRDAHGTPVVPPALRDRQQTTQLLKQADIVLLQFLFDEEYDATSKRANYAYYSPRTMHQSSLSPSTYAIMGVEVGDVREAWRNFRRGAFMDLEDRQDTVAKGIHAAALGGTWMAVVNGFAGMRLGMSGTLRFAPRLPQRWRRMRFRVSWRGARLQLTCTRRQVLVEHLGGGRGRARFEVWGTQVAIRPGERRRIECPTEG